MLVGGTGSSAQTPGCRSARPEGRRHRHQGLQRHVHDRALRLAGRQALLGRHAHRQGEGRQAGHQGERQAARRAHQRRGAGQPGPADPGRLPDPQPRARPDQPQPARAVRAHEPDQPAHRRRPGRRQPARQPAVRDHRHPRPERAGQHAARPARADPERAARARARAPNETGMGRRSDALPIAAFLSRCSSCPPPPTPGRSPARAPSSSTAATPARPTQLLVVEREGVLDRQVARRQELRLGAGLRGAVAGHARARSAGVTACGSSPATADRHRGLRAGAAADRRPRAPGDDSLRRLRRAARDGDRRAGERLGSSVAARRGDRDPRRPGDDSLELDGCDDSTGPYHADGGAGQRRHLARSRAGPA